ncbi:unnamed protein product [Porites lobata]|uniref:Galactosylceramide sulfotransferase n=1 Tax=Porites lobata TaxID=104759 RepID=A0ABN8P208_9CNID|nr:unnamed protein product [Porites lobata]
MDWKEVAINKSLAARCSSSVVMSYGFLMSIMRISECNLTFPLMKEPRHRLKQERFNDSEGNTVTSSYDFTGNQAQEKTSVPCKPVNNNLFLKVYKTGSSTVTNIFNRYGDKRDLIFALPTEDSFHWPLRFEETTRYITMLRDPPAQLESVFNYYDIYRKTFQPQSSTMTPLESFFQNITFYRSSRVLDGLGVDLNLLKNPSLFDLGLDKEYHENLTMVQDYIRFLQQEFDLVMLMEYFDESLVLLKRQLCWKMEDILFFKLNERVQKEKQHISNQVREQIKKWNSADVLLYDAFNQTLWQKIMKEGPDFFVDLSIFKKEKEAMKNKCLRKGKFLTKLWLRKKVQGYKLKTNISKELNTTCTKMTMNELKYLSYLQRKLTKQLQDDDDNRIGPIRMTR